MSNNQETLKKSIKSAQWFELFGEVSCLVGSIIFVVDALNTEETPFKSVYLWGSFCYGLGATSMIIQSVKTLQIRN